MSGLWGCLSWLFLRFQEPGTRCLCWEGRVRPGRFFGFTWEQLCWGQRAASPLLWERELSQSRESERGRKVSEQLVWELGRSRVDRFAASTELLGKFSSHLTFSFFPVGPNPVCHEGLRN